MTVRPELLSVDNSADTKDLEAEEGGLDVDVDTQSVTDDGVLVADEERRSGVVRLSVYWSYWLAVGRCLATFVLLSILLMQGLTFLFIFLLYMTVEVFFGALTLLVGHGVLIPCQ